MEKEGKGTQQADAQGGTSGRMTRRAFVGASAAAALALAAGCSPENKLGETPAGEKKVYRLDAELDESIEGKWVTASCSNNCGGMCLNRAYVVDGVAVRVKTDDSEEDSQALPQLRACPRGRSKRQDVFGADRLKYPMKRKNWEPFTGGKKELRGIDEWERISWDEALTYISDEIKNSISNYGSRSILLAGAGYVNPINNLLNKLGGYVKSSGTWSWGTAVFNAVAMGLPRNGIGEDNDRTDFVNADYLVIYGGNPAWASPGTYNYFFMEAKKAGTQFVFVGPEYNATASCYDAKWIQVRPGTDTAFLLAVAYEMFKADEAVPGSVIDWDFLEKYTVGIDGNSMPADAKVDENFKDYVMGAYDNTPKTAEWASKISGTPIEDIKWYAEMMKKDNAVTTLRSFAAFRCNDSDNLTQMYMVVGFLGGHIGKPGHCTGTAYHACVGSSLDNLFQLGDSGKAFVPDVLDDCFNDDEAWSAILNGTYNRTGNMMVGVLSPKDIRDIDIHMIIHVNSASIQIFSDIPKAIEAHRKVDFVFATARSFTSQAKYSDIVLPIATEWEFFGTIKGGSGLVNREAVVVATAVCDPLYEARTDQQYLYDLAGKLGLDPDEMFPISEAQQFYNILAGTKVKNVTNTEFETLFTITQEDINAWSVDGKPQEGRIALKTVLETGIYKIKREPSDAYTYYGYQNFIKDPVSAPLNTPSGKFEIYSQTKADTINAIGATVDYTWKPYPTYKVPINGYEASFVDFDAGIKGDYPYQITNPHSLRRSHTQFDNLPWLRQAFTQPLFISAVDAKEKGLSNGDVVRVWNDVGQVIRHISISERLMPGTVQLQHGAWVEIDPETGIDKAGADNMLCTAVSTGMRAAGYNTNLVNFEKYDDDLLAPDYEWPQRIIDFA
jgi:anaerobic dimethyl sulfoxide reductase subunit A